MSDKHRQDPEWFADTVQDSSPLGLLWGVFEGELFRAVDSIRAMKHSPVIRMSEKMFMAMLKGKYIKIDGPHWPIYLFRGIPIALRPDDTMWEVVEVLSGSAEGEDNAGYSFKLNTKGLI